MSASKRALMTRRRRGFTLLEVLIAMCLLAIALLVVMNAQDNGVLVSQYEEQQIQASGLARWKMVQEQLYIEKNGFPGDDDKEECGHFKEDLEETSFDGWDWCWTLKKVSLPIPMDLLGGQKDQQGGADQDAINANIGSTTSPNATAASALGFDPKAAAEQLSKAVRVLTVTVKWKFNGKEQLLPVTTHLVNTTQTQVLP